MSTTEAETKVRLPGWCAGEIVAGEDGEPVLPGTGAWLQARRYGIGASEAAAACGLSRWMSPHDLYYRKRSDTQEEPTERMEIGARLEGVILDIYAERTGRMLYRPVPLLRSREHEFVIATPDALADEPLCVEAKTTSPWRRAAELGLEGTDEVPTEWLLQAQQQCYVTGAQAVEFAVLVERKLHTYRVERDDELIEQMVEAERKLWERIQNGDPPPVDPSHPGAIESLRSLYRRINQETVELPQEAVAWIEERIRLKEELNALQRQYDQLTAKLMAAMGEAAVGVTPDGKYRLKRYEVKPSKVSYERKGYVALRVSEVKGI